MSSKRPKPINNLNGSHGDVFTEEKEQIQLPIDASPAWKEEWHGMPEFVQDRQREYAKITVRFRNQADLDDFCRRIGQKLNPNSQCTWHPELTRSNGSVKRYVDESKVSDLHRL